MTICSFSARRRYFDRSSLISDRATCFITFTMFGKPVIGFGFRDNRQDLHRLLSHIVKHPYIATDTKAVLGVREPSQPLDAAFAHFRRLMPQMRFNGVTHR